MTKNKKLPQDLKNVLENPACKKALKPGFRKVYIGHGSSNLEDGNLVPIWLPNEALSSHCLIGGAIGSGKTMMTMRLIAGALKNYGTIVIGEAKGGKNGSAEGAAFTDLGRYLSKQLGYPVYRWPRGNCWFNPLLYLREAKDRKAFFETLCNQMQSSTGISGDMLGFLYNAANIAELILEFLGRFSTRGDIKKTCTLRSLVKYLQRPDRLQQDINTFLTNGKEYLKTLTGEAYQNCAEDLELLEDLQYRLMLCNFFF